MNGLLYGAVDFGRRKQQTHDDLIGNKNEG